MALDWSCYGYRRVTHELKRQGVTANHKRALRLMCKENLLRRPKKRFVATTNSDHRLPVYPNLAAEMDIAAPDQSEYDNLTDAKVQIGHFLEAVYNQKRLHSSLDYLPPTEFEQAYKEN